MEKMARPSGEASAGENLSLPDDNPLARIARADPVGITKFAMSVEEFTGEESAAVLARMRVLGNQFTSYELDFILQSSPDGSSLETYVVEELLRNAWKRRR